jgi:hypothetical protein
VNIPPALQAQASLASKHSSREIPPSDPAEERGGLFAVRMGYIIKYVKTNRRV